MSVELRPDRGKWGYRFIRVGKCYKCYRWETEAEALAAEKAARLVAENNAKCTSAVPDLAEMLGTPTLTLKASDARFPCVYAVLSALGGVLYIGMSAQGILRPLGHNHHLADQIKNGYTVAVWKYKTTEEAAAVERELIA